MIKKDRRWTTKASFPPLIILCLFLTVFLLFAAVFTQSASTSPIAGNNLSTSKPLSAFQSVNYIPDMTYERKTFTPIEHNNIIYAIGGIRPATPAPSVEVYNISTNSWGAGPTTNQPTGICACVLYDEWIYSFQGTTVKALDVSKPLSQQIMDGWQTITTSNVNMQEPYGAVVIGTKAYVTGKNALNLCFYDFVTGNGGIESALPLSRTMGFGMCGLGKVVYILGGSTSGSYNLMGYNTVTKGWTHMYGGGSYNCRAVSYNGKIYEVGGGGSTTNYCGNEINEISPEDGSYVAYDTMAELRGEMGVVVVGNELYVLGGDRSNVTVSKSMEIVTLPTPPSVDIEANGSDSPIMIYQGEMLSVSVNLSPEDYAGVRADWWLLIQTPIGWYHYNMSGGWDPGMVVSRQGNVLNVPPHQVLHTSGLAPGSYLFIFGVDFLENGVVNRDQAIYDFVRVTIIP